MKRRPFLSPASLLCCALASVLGLGTGWLIHRARGSTPSLAPSRNDPTDAADQTTPSSMPMRRAVGKSSDVTNDDAVSADDPLAVALATTPRIERWLMLVAAAEKATPSEMPRLLRLCEGDEAAVRMVAARWAEMDPHHMWQTVMAQGAKDATGAATSNGLGFSPQELARLLLESWTARDAASVRAALTAAKDFPGIENLRMNTLQALMKSDPETTLGLLKEWNIRHFYPDLNGLSEWAEKNPVRAAEVVKNCGSDVGAMKALETVGKAWAKSDPQAALAFAGGLPPMQRASFAGGAMKQWATKDPKAAAAYVAELPDASLRASLALPLVESWTVKAPQQALDWAQDTLRGEARANALGHIVGALAQQDVARAADLVAEMDSGGSKNKAIGSLVEKWFEKNGATPVAEWLLKLPEPDARDAGFEKLGFQWIWNGGREGAAKAAELATGPQRDLVPASFVMILAANEARNNPEAAMKWTSQLPPDRIPMVRDRVLAEWMQARPEAAAQWVLAQPAGNDRRDLVISASRYLAWNTATAAAEKFFAELPAADQVMVRETLGTTHMPADKKQSLLKALDDR